MTERIPKCIVNKNVVYDAKYNQSAFLPKGNPNYGLHVVYNNPDKIYLYLGKNNIIVAILKDCLFLYEDDVDKYPEYFI
jgi:hypothetical protein